MSKTRVLTLASAPFRTLHRPEGPLKRTSVGEGSETDPMAAKVARLAVKFNAISNLEVQKQCHRREDKVAIQGTFLRARLPAPVVIRSVLTIPGSIIGLTIKPAIN